MLKEIIWFLNPIENNNENEESIFFFSSSSSHHNQQQEIIKIIFEILLVIISSSHSSSHLSLGRDVMSTFFYFLFRNNNDDQNNNNLPSSSTILHVPSSQNSNQNDYNQQELEIIGDQEIENENEMIEMIIQFCLFSEWREMILSSLSDFLTSLLNYLIVVFKDEIDWKMCYFLIKINKEI